MKHLIKTLSVLALALFVAVPAIKASTVEAARTAIGDLRSMTAVLTVTKAKDTAKTRADLMKRLQEAQRALDAGGTKNYYKAAIKVYEYCLKVAEHVRKGRVDAAEGQVLIGMALTTVDCIVDIYCPTCVWP